PLVLWDLLSGTKLRELRSDRLPHLFSCAFAPDGWRAITTGLDRSLLLWDLATGQLLDTIDLAPGDDRPTSMAFAPDGKALFVGTARGVVLEFSVAPGR